MSLDTAGPGAPAGGRPGPAPEPDDQVVARVEATVTAYLQRRRAEAEQVHPAFAGAADVLADFVRAGGKRLRPTFAWWGWRGAGGDPHGPDAEPALSAVSALELIQACALVHDDLIDASDTRRGRPTVHVEFTDRHRRAGLAGPSARYGDAVAILLGDLALAWADDMLAEAGLGGAAWSRARPVWSAMRTEMLGGQFLDSWCQAGAGDDPARTGGPGGAIEAALRVCRFKTAAYTVERPLHLGAALAGADPDLVAAYRRFGADIGVAFQLRDDLLGVFGDPGVTGKPAGDDLREGKRTVLVELALDAARRTGRASEHAVLTDALGDPLLDAGGVDRAREALHALGAVDEVERRIARLTESGLAALTAAQVAPPAGTRLVELAHTATRRSS